MDAGKELDTVVIQNVFDKNLPYSTDLAAAWLLVEKICEDGYRFQLDGSKIWQARFYKSVSHTLETKAFLATARTPAAAICKAALAVRGIDTLS